MSSCLARFDVITREALEGPNLKKTQRQHSVSGAERCQWSYRDCQCLDAVVPTYLLVTFKLNLAVRSAVMSSSAFSASSG
jgi:hypothetical protein